MAKVESPRMLMRAMGSIWTATFNCMDLSGVGPLKAARLVSSIEALCQGVRSGAGIERRYQMAWQAPRRNQHRIKAQIEIGVFGMRHQPGLGRFDDALLLARGYRIGRLVEAGAGLDLDKCQQISPP